MPSSESWTLLLDSDIEYCCNCYYYHCLLIRFIVITSTISIIIIGIVLIRIPILYYHYILWFLLSNHIHMFLWFLIKQVTKKKSWLAVHHSLHKGTTSSEDSKIIASNFSPNTFWGLDDTLRLQPVIKFLFNKLRFIMIEFDRCIQDPRLMLVSWMSSCSCQHLEVIASEAIWRKQSHGKYMCI